MKIRFTKDNPIGRRFTEIISPRIECAAGEEILLILDDHHDKMDL